MIQIYCNSARDRTIEIYYKDKSQTKSLCNDMFIAMYLFRLSNNGFA